MGERVPGERRVSESSESLLRLQQILKDMEGEG
jgi:hypothetical protein